MKKYKSRMFGIIILIVMLVSSLGLVGCDNPLGMLSLPQDSITLNNTLFATNNLALIPNNLRDDANYSIMVKGTTSELSEDEWIKWFGDEEWDVNGRLAVVLRLRYDSDILSDTEASLTLTGLDNTDLNQTIDIADLPPYLIDSQYIYIVLNIKHNLVVLSINNHIQGKLYTTKYLINMMRQLRDELIFLLI